MDKLRIHEGRVWVGDVFLTLDELKILRPQFPEIPNRLVGLRYDGAVHIMSDGKNQRVGPVPWDAGDALLAGKDRLAADLKELRGLNQDTPIDRETSDGELYDEKIASDPTFKNLLIALNNGTFVPGGRFNRQELKAIIVPDGEA